MSARAFNVACGLVVAAIVAASVLTGCGSTRTVTRTVTVTRTAGKALCADAEQMTRCALDVIRDLAVNADRNADVVKGKCLASGSQWRCTVQYPDSTEWDGPTVCLEVLFEESSELRLPVYLAIVKAPETRCGAVLGST